MKATKFLATGSLALIFGALPTQSFSLHRAHTHLGIQIGIGRPHYHGIHFYHRPFLPVGFYGTRVVQVRPVNYGEVDFNVKPQNSKVYVDGKYLGTADDYNGFPQTAKLPVGYHNVRVVAPDGRSEERRIYVAAGEELNFNVAF